MTDKRNNIVLKVIAGPGNGISVPLTPGRHIVGSGAGCAIRIEHESVAALHAMLVVGDDVLRVYPVQRAVQLHTGAESEAVEVNGSELELQQRVSIGDSELLVVETANASINDEETIQHGVAPVSEAGLALEQEDDLPGEFNVGIESVVDAPLPAVKPDSVAGEQVAGTIADKAQESEQIRSARASASSPERLGPFSRAANHRDKTDSDDVFGTPAPPLADSVTAASPDRKPMVRKSGVNQNVLPQGRTRKEPARRRATGDPTAANSLAAAARRTLASVSSAGGNQPGNSRALVTVAQPQQKANEAFALVVSGAVNVSDNVKRGFWSFWRDGFGRSNPALIGVLLASIIGLLFIADRQTVAVHDDTVSPTGSISADLVSAGFTQLSVTEGSDNRIHLSGFVRDDQEKQKFDQIVSGYKASSFSRVNVTVATELLASISEVLNQYGMDRLKLTYLGPGRIQIDGYVGPAQDWHEVVATLRRDFKSISEIDDAGVETLAVRLADLKFMLLDVDLGELSVEPEGASVAVMGSLPTLKISDWVGVMTRFQTKYNSSPEIVNKVEQKKPKPMPAVPIAGTMQIGGRKYITVEPSGSMYGEGDYMPDGTQVKRIENDRVVFFRNGYEYPQAFNSGVLDGHVAPVRDSDEKSTDSQRVLENTDTENTDNTFVPASVAAAMAVTKHDQRYQEKNQ